MRIILALLLASGTAHGALSAVDPFFRNTILRPAASGASGSTELGSDAFTRANETPLASPWLDADTSSANTEFNLASNSATPELISHDAAMYKSGITWASNQYAQVKITVTGTTAGSGPGVIVRAGSGAPNWSYYRIAICKNATICDIGKSTVGTYSNLGTRTGTWVDGDTLRVEATGTTTVTIKVFQNGVQLGADITDSSSALQAGVPGLFYSSSVTSCTLDDYSAGSIP